MGRVKGIFALSNYRTTGLADVSDIFYFFLLGEEEGRVRGRWEGGGSDFLLKIPESPCRKRSPAKGGRQKSDEKSDRSIRKSDRKVTESIPITKKSDRTPFAALLLRHPDRRGGGFQRGRGRGAGSVFAANWFCFFFSGGGGGNFFFFRGRNVHQDDYLCHFLQIIIKCHNLS